MSKTSKTILFFGNERLATGVTTATPALRALLDGGYRVPAVIVAQADMASSRRSRPLEIAETAREHGIPLLAPDDLMQAKEQLAALHADAAVLIAYGKIVPPEILALFPAGIINIHPSLLPLHRGSTPIESVLLNAAGQTGVSLMKLSEKMDAGPLYEQQTVALRGDETKQELADKLAGIGTDMLSEALPGVLDGTAHATPQDTAKATVDQHITKQDGRLDWSKPAARLACEVRAYAGWPRSRAQIGDFDVILTSVRAVDGTGTPGEHKIDGKQLSVYTGSGLLIIDRLIPAGKREMTAEAFLAGYRL